MASCCIGALPVLWDSFAPFWLGRREYGWSAAALTAAAIAAIAWLAALYARQVRSGEDDTLGSSILNSLIRYSPLALTVVDRNGTIVEATESAGQLIGFRRSELIGQSFVPYMDTGSRKQALQQFEQTLLGYPQDAVLSLRHKAGYAIDLHVIASPLKRGSRIEGAVILTNDISERKRTTERIKYMANYDDMTGLPNRKSFMQKVSEALPRGEGPMAAVFYLDVDRFKLINASFGREFGDMLLMQIAERLTRELAWLDIAARMEGDEFAILFTDVLSETDAGDKARSIMRGLEEPFELQGVPLHITVSIGIGLSVPGCDDAEALLKKADMALAKVKESGKNGYLVYSEQWDNQSLARLTLEHDLKRAFKQGEFVLMYQPQYHLMTGNIVGVEALVRWRHPERGLVPPSEFIPMAEENGMIVDLGDWVMLEACRQNKAWQDAGLPAIPVSVNLSIRQFLQQNLTKKVEDILLRTGLKAKYLDLEITETMTMDIGHAAKCLVELTMLGVNISIDDFGTGYSSFHYLKNLPIGKLKIDRSFVRDIEQDPGDAAIVAAIIAMAHNLNLQVIAEGVENEEQMRFLQLHACDEMQGFLWSPPVPEGRIAEMLQAPPAG